MRRTGDQPQTYSVGEAARRTGVTVRTLHYYDDIGLLRASVRTEAGYRRYTERDVDALRRVRLFRTLGFTLEEVRPLLDAPDGTLRAALVDQRTALLRRLEETRDLVQIIDRVQGGTPTGSGGSQAVERDDIRDALNEFRTAEFEEEARERWGGTDAWRESKRRVATYGLDDWKAMAEEAKAINDGLLAQMQAGRPASSTEAAALAEEHRLHISKWFYDCAPEIHVGLADMYVADPRCRAHYDQQAPGFADYVAQAIHANAERAA